MPDPEGSLSDFRQWWTKGDTDSPAGQLALRSPAAETAYKTFRAGWEKAAARERQRIREGSRLCNNGTEYSIPADLLDGDNDAR